jgi:hypothetical protein
MAESAAGVDSAPTIQSEQRGGRGLNQSPPMEWAVMLSIPPAEMSSPVGS